jgi:glycine/D-amino acid oxidase-like deaminating enzyme
MITVTVARVIVVGSGIFGVTAALALRRRRHQVTLADPGPVPHPLAESTDVSKIVRIDYGDDELYTTWMERALTGWRSAPLAPLFHETGVLFLRRPPFERGGFEHDSFELLSRRGHRLERLDTTAILARFPAWTSESTLDGYYNPVGGWAESARVVSRLVAQATDEGVTVLGGVDIERVLEKGSRVVGVATRAGDEHLSDFVVVSAGSWTPALVPATKDALLAVGQPVFHLVPSDPSRFASACFPVFGADISRTGYYGFPLNSDGHVKIANHGVGRTVDPRSDARRVTDDETRALRSFLREWLPDLERARIVSTRLCVYGDTRDQHFFIAPDPDRSGLVVAAGGSGHAFKFAPLLGDWIADALDGEVIERFRWRTAPTSTAGEERARRQG